MADRYWVGGSGNWDATSTANWAATSGGTAGASAPTSVDNVIFDANSNVGTGAFTVTVTGTSAAPAVCNDFSTGGAGGALDGAMTLSQDATSVLDVYGSMTLPATNFTWSGTSGNRIRFRATTTGKTITTNGVTIGGGTNTQLEFTGSGGEWTLGSALTITGSVLITQGTFRTANFNVTTGVNFFHTPSIGTQLTRAVYLGSSTISTTGTFGAITVGTLTNITFDAGTSQINCPNSGANFLGGGLTYYNVSFTNTGGGVATITGANTFNNLTFTTTSATGIRRVSIGANQTINGTLTLGAANTAIRRVQLFSDVVGTARTVTVNGTLATLADVDFRDITAAGTVATPWTGTRLGNGGNLTNITTATPKTVYRVGTGNWSATQWSTSSGGSVDVNNLPLAQDTAIFDTGTVTGTHTIDLNWWIGNFDCSALNVAVTLSTGQSPVIHGNFTLDADITLTGAGQFVFSGASNQTIISAGRTITQAPLVIKPTTTSFILGDALTTSNNFVLNQGTLDLNGYDLTCLGFFSNVTTVRSIAFGTKKIVVTGNNGTIWNVATAENFSYTGTSQVDCTYSGSTGTRTINHNTTGTVTQIEEKALNFNITAGTDIIAPASGTPSFNNLNFTGFSGTLSNISLAVCNSLIVSTGMTLASGSNTMFFAKTTGTCTITSNGKIFDFPVTLTRTGVVRLEDALTLGSSRTFTLTQGTLDLNGYDLSCGVFSSDNSNTRSINFGAKRIYVADTRESGSQIIAMPTMTNFTYTGSGIFNVNNSGSGTKRCAVGVTAGGTESNAISIECAAGTGILKTFGHFKDINLTGYSGQYDLQEIGATINKFIYGDMTISSTTTVLGGSTNNLTFQKSSGTQTLVSAGKTFDCPVVKSAAGTLQLSDNLTMGSTRTFTLTQGTLNLDGKTLSTGLFSSSNSNVRTLNLGANGKITVTGSGTTAWNAGTSTNLTLSGTGTVELTSASAKTFAGGSKVYPYTLNQGGTGTLTITGSNTFADITATVSPSTITFPASTITTVKDFSVSGTLGNLVTLNSSTPGTRWTLFATGLVSCSYVSISDSNGTPPFLDYGEGSVNAGNNVGWVFALRSSITEAVTNTDSENFDLYIFRDISEDSGLADVNQSQVNFNSEAIELVEMLEAEESVSAIFNSDISENAVVDDIATGRGWFKINDGQTPNWVDVDDNQ